MGQIHLFKDPGRLAGSWTEPGKYLGFLLAYHTWTTLSLKEIGQKAKKKNC